MTSTGKVPTRIRIKLLPRAEILRGRLFAARMACIADALKGRQCPCRRQSMQSQRPPRPQTKMCRNGGGWLQYMERLNAQGFILQAMECTAMMMSSICRTGLHCRLQPAVNALACSKTSLPEKNISLRIAPVASSHCIAPFLSSSLPRVSSVRWQPVSGPAALSEHLQHAPRQQLHAWRYGFPRPQQRRRARPGGLHAARRPCRMRLHLRGAGPCTQALPQ